ncbi:zinc ribbon domain-containing protein [Streptomyces sp. NPDC005708]|uniref:zinc ribbon domain-containing protein n=1 Tax=unclassified Streptomyces TaxID=2593676 RepID=UPI0033D8BDC4
MSKTPEPRPNGDGTFAANGAAAKAGLNRSIADAGWGVFPAVLTAKAEGAGREVMAGDPRNISRRCPECGHTAKENRPTQQTFQCIACSHTAHADTVAAALNVLRAGLARRKAQPVYREATPSGGGGVTGYSFVLQGLRVGGLHSPGGIASTASRVLEVPPAP